MGIEIEKPLTDVEHYILNSLKGLEYGTVEITVHNAKIVQIERSEKRRFEQK